METLSKNKLKWIHSLRLKKNRNTENVFVVEGDKIVNELIDEYPGLIELIVVTSEELTNHPSAQLISHPDMKKISQFKTPTNLLAVVRIPTVQAKNNQLILAIDGVQDPGNLGTILRTADWFGVDHIICSLNTVDAYNPKVVQSSMGSIFRMRIDYCELVDYITTLGKPVYGALLNGDNLYTDVLEEEAVLVVGNEGSGISPEVEAIVNHPVLIPKKGHAESLNVAIATGILLAEFSK